MQIMTEYNGAGIYAIRNSINGKRYVGSSIHCTSRAGGHTDGLNKGKHPNAHLLSSWRKYGADAFVFEILEECAPDRATLLKKEMDWVLKLKSDDPEFGYNKAYPYRQIRPSAWMSARHKQYWNSLLPEEREERVAHLASIEQQRSATASKRKPVHRNRASKQVTQRWAEDKEFAESVRSQIRQRLSDQLADPERWAPIGAKISHKAQKRWKKPEYRERGLKQLNEASLKAAQKLHSDPEAMAERLDLLEANRPKAADAIRARWKDPEFRARRIAQMKMPRKRKK